MTVNWKRSKFSPHEFEDVVKSSRSWRECAKKLGLNPDAGGAYYSLKAKADDLDLDTSHFQGQGWNKGDISGNLARSKRSLDEILVENSTYLSTSNLKRRLLQEGLLEYRCYAPYCPVPSPTVHPFTGEQVELKLALDHINGTRSDNRIENLRLLCYHCHGYTETWCGSSRNANATVALCACGSQMSNGAARCQDCEHKTRKGRKRPNSEKIAWPSNDELLSLVKASSYVAVGRELGVSDNAIRKRLRNHK